MDFQKSRNGFYTLTFVNKNNLDQDEIVKEFNTVGKVCKVVQKLNRIFIRFKEKEEAERALMKYGTSYGLSVAKNKASENQQTEAPSNLNSKAHNNPSALLATDAHGLPQKLNTSGRVYNLILAHLPKNYTIKDVKALVEEAKPIYINQIEETRVFNIRFCHIMLSSAENVTYLIEKLNGFMICGEKLLATEVKHLLEWREKTV